MLAAGNFCAAGAAAALPCLAGTYSNTPGLTAASECTDCPKGSACSTGSTAHALCAPGTIAPALKAETCTDCTAGTFQDMAGQTECKACTAGYYCAEGAAAALPCPGGTHMPADDCGSGEEGSGEDGSGEDGGGSCSSIIMSSASQCTVCEQGTFCPVGSKAPTDCAPGTFNAQVQQETCSRCIAGTYQSRSAKTSCDECPRGFYCIAGAATPVPCPGGTSSNSSGVQEKKSCKPVGLGFWAPLGSAIPEPCPASGFYCPGAAEDTVNAAPGSKPIIVPVGDSTTTKEVTSRPLQASPAFRRLPSRPLTSYSLPLRWSPCKRR